MEQIYTEKNHSVLNDMNTQFGYYLIEPFSHEYNKGALYQKTINTIESYLKNDFEVGNVADLLPVYKNNGINFFKLGKGSSINKITTQELVSYIEDLIREKKMKE